MRKVDRAAAIDASMPRLEASIAGVPIQETILMRLTRALGQSMTRFLEKVIGPHGFSEGSLHTLMLIACMEPGEATPGLLCDLVAQTPANMTRILANLEAQGYITRSAHARDGRRSQLELSKAGRSFIEKTLPGLIEPVKLALSGLSAAEMKQLEKLLRKTIVSIDAAVTRLDLPASSVRRSAR